jgi:ADP-ribose pyrophosphatase
MAEETPRRVEVIEHETPFEGRYRVDRYKLRHETFGGGWGKELTREVMERGNAVGLLPYDPRQDRIVLVEQFRIGAFAAGRPPWMTEIVAGLVEEGERPEDVARRECREECGCAVEAIVPIMTMMPSAGVLTERVSLFCGRVDSSKAGRQGGVAGEDIRVLVLPADEVLRRLAAGAFESATTIIALQWFALSRDRLRRAWS